MLSECYILLSTKNIKKLKDVAYTETDYHKYFKGFIRMNLMYKTSPLFYHYTKNGIEKTDMNVIDEVVESNIFYNDVELILEEYSNLFYETLNKKEINYFTLYKKGLSSVKQINEYLIVKPNNNNIAKELLRNINQIEKRFFDMEDNKMEKIK